MRSFLCVLGATALAVLPATTTPAAAADSSFTIEDPRITESSGLAASRAHPGIYWTHNDSDDGPYIYAVEAGSGRTVATVTLRGVGDPRDVEAITVGPDRQIYVGDIGDNLGGAWPHVWVYRFAEPKKLRDTTVDATQYTVQYDDGPHDAEALMVHPRTGRVYIAGKGKGGGGLYQGPARLSPSGANIFRRIADIDLWVTDGAFSPDGSRLVARGYFGAKMYAWADGRPKRLGTVSVPMQPQGESVTFTPDGRALMFGTEGERSLVTRVALRGEDLPDTVAGAPDRKGGPAEGTGSGDGSSPAIGEDGEATTGALTLAAAAALILGLRRLLRRR